MFTLVIDKSSYYKIKYGQTAKQIQKELKIPIIGEAFCGKIIYVGKREFIEYSVKVGETYKTIAEKLGADLSELVKINGDKPVYPTCKIFVPK